MGLLDWLTKDDSANLEVDKQENKAEADDAIINEEEIERNLEDLRNISNCENSQPAVQYVDDEYEDNSYTPCLEPVQTLTETPFQPVQPIRTAQQPNASFTIYKIIDEEDVRLVLKHLSNNCPCIATFYPMSKKTFNLLMKYLMGGLYVMGANISEWQKDSYILVPSGMSIDMKEKSRRKRR